jgi:glycine/D-amino acid oxidase-like deaminating enzyme
MTTRRRVRVAVFGAGAFGGWTALELVRRGAAVQLVEAWGAGNVRSSSGGETRVIRATYGSHAAYTRMAAHALERWRRYGADHDSSLLHHTGALWIFPSDHPFRNASMATLRAEGLPIEELTPAEAHRRFPQFRMDDVEAVLFEPEAGYLLARAACASVARRMAAEGGTLLRGAAPEPLPIDGPLRSVTLRDGRVVEADAFVFACGPWLPVLFPDVVGPAIAVTRQEVYYLATPAGDPSFDDGMPVWLELSDRFIYGIPGNARRGFKVADDSPGAPMDPTSGDRVPTVELLASVRAFVAHRFPRLANAAVIGAEVCQYESTPDSHFVMDRHPRAANVWLAGGGSGHGFKMGPVIGEMVAALVLGDAAPDPFFGLQRFEVTPEGGWQAKWS